MPQITLSLHLEEGHYSAPTEWRLLGARDKADHVIDLCQRNGLKPTSLLEVGAGDGAILRCLSEKRFCASMSALEVSPSGVSVIKSQQIPGLVSCEVFNGYQLPFEDGRFDLVVLSHVLEHVEFERALLREIQRVSRHSVIEIPMDFTNLAHQDYHFLGPSYGHINAHSPGSLRFLLFTEGLIVKDELLGRYSPQLQEYDFFENGRRPRTPELVRQFRDRALDQQQRYASLPLQDRERQSNYYAALVQRETAQERRERALRAACNYIDADRLQAARLIFDHYVPDGDLAAALMVARHARDTRAWLAAREFSDRVLARAPLDAQASEIRKQALAGEAATPPAGLREAFPAPLRAGSFPRLRRIARRIPLLVRLVRWLRA